MLMLTKSPNVLVTPLLDRPGLALAHQQTGRRRELNERDAALWLQWPQSLQPGHPDDSTGQSFLRDGFAESRPADEDTCASPSPALPIAAPHARWYSESPDCTILFNSAPMAQNNPLLVLNPLGSLLWRGIIAARPVAEVRADALRIFGHDPSTSFYHRLQHLGFLEGAAPIDSAAPDAPVCEFSAPSVQCQLPHARVPWYCLWELGRQCDLRCRVCYLPDFNHPGPDAPQVRRTIDQIIESGIFYVCLLGGEPLLRADLNDIVARLRAAGVFVKIITNGLQLTPARARELAQQGLNQIEISFDGLTRFHHEHSRGPGTFPAAISAVRAARDAGIPRIAMVLTLHAAGLDDLPALPDFMHKLGIREAYLSPFRTAGQNAPASGYEPLGPAGLRAVAVHVDRWRNDHPDFTIALGSQPICSCGRTSMVIGADAQVRICSFGGPSIGDLSHQSPAEIWSSLKSRCLTPGPLGYCANSQPKPTSSA